ncbi:putative C6 transcription factor [Cucurbitaria berberidis CBS 394.84]|uniref:C6 transcription factor n=1 Tax=Cucurbitaria berberidis CBS 394.84 TaxID=1168544 RepID=A0A9P4L974_9PLEO|nr:putative C6 transcription factor [Cucurbitaria berberidis CBS 394.84]KAF1846113.1 putative C6 transcription factor [Cucurbitaria berberidis CBS 394.84]
MPDEPASKRRRLDEDGPVNTPADFVSTFLPTPVTENGPGVDGYGFENMDPFLSPATASSWPFDEFAHDPDYLASQEALRSLLFTTARSVAPTRAGTPVDGDEPAGVVNIKQVLSKGRRVQYLKNYMSQVAPWLDMFDSKRAFGIQLPALAKESPPLLYAILAIGARQLERKEKTQSSFDSLELYQEAIRLLTPLLSARDTQVIAACVILCCLEMFSASAQDWRHHLEGCAAVFEAFGVNGFSDDILQAVFWCYARMDVCGALISDGTESTLLKPSQWLPVGMTEDTAESLFRNAPSPDMYANFAVYLCAKTCELISDRNKYVELGTENGCDAPNFQQRWSQLWVQLCNWALYRPKEMLPIVTTNTMPFPHILFAHWAAISSNQLYHTSCVLLLNANSKQKIALGSSHTASLMWHVKRICGISLTNPHEGCLNNAIQPLWIAGRLLSHSSEQALVVKTIRHIEVLTGWTATWRIRDLESTWGYKVRLEA